MVTFNEEAEKLLLKLQPLVLRTLMFALQTSILKFPRAKALAILVQIWRWSMRTKIDIRR